MEDVVVGFEGVEEEEGFAEIRLLAKRSSKYLSSSSSFIPSSPKSSKEA